MDLESLEKKTSEMFWNIFKQPADGLTSCPGRINILGDHTDYLFGKAMPAAINRWTILGYSSTESGVFRFLSCEEDSQWQIKPDLSTDFSTLEPWQKYIYASLDLVKGLISHDKYQRLAKGLDVLIWSNIPFGKGLSSSASYELSLLHTLCKVANEPLSPSQAIETAQKIENTYLNLPSGRLDQVACQESKADKIMMIDFSASKIIQKNMHPNFQDWSWVCVDSGVKRSLDTSHYKTRVDECYQGLRLIQVRESTIKSFEDVTHEHLKFLEHHPIPKKRMLHMLGENERVAKGVLACQDGDIYALGQLMNESHLSLKNLHQVSCEKLDVLQDYAKHQDECLGSRMMGGGFGGCTLNLVKKSCINNFCKKIKEHFYSHYETTIDSFPLSLVDGVR